MNEIKPSPLLPWPASNFLEDFYKTVSIHFQEVKMFHLLIFLATERPLKVMKNSFYLILKALFVVNKFKFLS